MGSAGASEEASRRGQEVLRRGGGRGEAQSAAGAERCGGDHDGGARLGGKAQHGGDARQGGGPPTEPRQAARGQPHGGGAAQVARGDQAEEGAGHSVCARLRATAQRALPADHGGGVAPPAGPRRRAARAVRGRAPRGQRAPQGHGGGGNVGEGGARARARRRAGGRHARGARVAAGGGGGDPCECAGAQPAAAQPALHALARRGRAAAAHRPQAPCAAASGLGSDGGGGGGEPAQLVAVDGRGYHGAAGGNQVLWGGVQVSQRRVTACMISTTSSPVGPQYLLRCIYVVELHCLPCGEGRGDAALLDGRDVVRVRLQVQPLEPAVEPRPVRRYPPVYVAYGLHMHPCLLDVAVQVEPLLVVLAPHAPDQVVHAMDDLGVHAPRRAPLRVLHGRVYIRPCSGRLHPVAAPQKLPQLPINPR
mmetsp:Transcript_50459/g.161473  ORF Transcript_50459/g.161473 Transcript_50459/m.161473 type:complete len:421 (+) Transcript_50459:1474-2736(+)